MGRKRKGEGEEEEEALDLRHFFACDNCGHDVNMKPIDRRHFLFGKRKQWVKAKINFPLIMVKCPACRQWVIWLELALSDADDAEEGDEEDAEGEE